MTSDQIRGELRVLDQSVTAFSVLRDRYGRRETFLSIVLLVGSAAVTGLAVAGDNYLAALGLADGDAVRAWIALAGIGLFAASLIQSRLNWASRSQLFAHAADSCARLKARYVEARDAEDPSQPGRLEDMRREYRILMAWLPRIPDQQFVALKAEHRRKVAVSRFLDRRPFVPLWWIRLVLTYRELRSIQVNREIS